MSLRLSKATLHLSGRRRRWILFLAAVGLSGYGAYHAYHLPSITAKRRKLSLLIRALVSSAEAVASSAETLALVSSDLNRFICSDSDEIPTSLKQISKIARSDEFSDSLSRASEALTVGITRGFQSGSDGLNSSGFSDKLLDKLFSTSGSGFASIVVGSFARSLVIAHCARETSDEIDSSTVPGWLCLICSDKGRELVADSIQLFVSTAVAVYLDKTMDINIYDEIFAGLTNPKHKSQMKDLLVMVCNCTVETLVKTSHQVLSGSNSSSPEASDREKAVDGRNSFDLKAGDGGGWINQVSSTLAVPSNRRFILDVTGRVAFETVRSFLDYLLQKLYDGAMRGANAFHEEVIERGLELVRFISAKSTAIITMCLILCLHMMVNTRFLMPA